MAGVYFTVPSSFIVTVPYLPSVTLTTFAPSWSAKRSFAVTSVSMAEFSLTVPASSSLVSMTGVTVTSTVELYVLPDWSVEVQLTTSVPNQSGAGVYLRVPSGSISTVPCCAAAPVTVSSTPAGVTKFSSGSTVIPVSSAVTAFVPSVSGAGGSPAVGRSGSKGLAPPSKGKRVSL